MTSPETWIPAAGALLLQVGSLDRDLGEWAADQNPIFGSRSRAADASDLLLHATEYTLVLTGLFLILRAFAVPIPVGLRLLHEMTNIPMCH